MTDISLASTAAAQPATVRRRTLRPIRSVAAGFGLLAGMLWSDGMPGSVLGLAILAFIGAVIWFNRRPWTRRTELFAGLSLLSALAVIIAPNLVNITVAWVTIALLWLAFSGHDFGNLAATGLRLAALAIGAQLRLLLWPLALQRIARGLRQRRGSVWRLLLLPLAAGSVFTLLLGAANPIIADLIGRIDFLALITMIAPSAAIAAVASVLLVWPLLRRRRIAAKALLDIEQTAPRWHGDFLSVPPVLATLVLLNGLFALQNGLDLRYLWWGEGLPPGFSHSEYVHRGAYTLIATALAAGLLVILALWPGSATERSLTVRLLVHVWIAQTILLVISSIQRTLAYVFDYGLTLTRFHGLIWMALVAAGLFAIILRIGLRRGNRWLVNTALTLAYATVFVLGFVDAPGIVAGYNAERAGCHSSADATFDVRYMESLGAPALPAFDRADVVLAAKGCTRLGREAKASGTALRELVAAEQSSWRRWVLRTAWQQARAPARRRAPTGAR